MPKYLLLLPILFLASCVESRKAGDKGRLFDRAVAEHIHANERSEASKKLVETAIHNQYEVPSVIPPILTAIGNKSGTIASALSTVTSLDPTLVGGGIATVIIATIGAIKAHFKRKKDDLEWDDNAEMEKEISKILPAENHEEYEEAKKQAKINIKRRKENV